MFINGKRLKVRRYSSGELKLIRSSLDSYIVDNKVRIIYLQGYSLFELLIIVNYYVSRGVCVDLVLGYLPYQRMDHKGRDELDTVNYVANIFNSLNLNSITICEPHCNVNCFKNARSFSYVKLIKDRVFKEIDFGDDDTVVLTDKGGFSKYGDIAKKVVYFNKERDIDSGLIIKHGIVGNIDVDKKAVIVDDIISTGDTIINIIDELSRLGVKDIYVLSGHIENNKYNRRIIEHENVKRVYSTTSLRKRGSYKLKLYNVEKIIK